ncbi:MAG: hypothetical protein K2M69_08520 [Muribaculaceae bacterium]|nr:hypothetical protein [Muribaculaceae bacterium]
MEEEKKLKTVTVEVFGYEKWLEPKDSGEEEIYDARSRYAEDGMIFTVGDKEYTPSDFSDADDFLTPEQQEIYKDLDASEFFAESGAKEGWLYINKAWTTIEIEMREDEDFDPSKAALVLRDFIYPDGSDEPTVCAFVYDGKVYDCDPEDSRGISGDRIWRAVTEDEKKGGIEYTNETATEEQLSDVSTLPVLVFRYQTLSYCYEPRDEFDPDDFPEFEGNGVISAVNDAGEGTMFICQDTIEYINNGEMDEILQDERLTSYEITLSVTEKEYILLNSEKKCDDSKILETIAAIWEPSHENCKYSPMTSKLIFRAIARDPEDYSCNYDYLLDNGKIYELPEGRFNEIIAGLSEEDQKLNNDITPFGEYEED